MTGLRSLPLQHASVPWPTREWPAADLDAAVDSKAIRATADTVSRRTSEGLTPIPA